MPREPSWLGQHPLVVRALAFTSRGIDAITLILLLWIIGVVLVSGFDRAWIADHHVAEPLVVLAVLVPLRIAIGGPGRSRASLARRAASTRLWAPAGAATSPTVSRSTAVPSQRRRGRLRVFGSVGIVAPSNAAGL